MKEFSARLCEPSVDRSRTTVLKMISRRSRTPRVGRNGAWLLGAFIAFCAESAHAGHEPLVPEPRTILLRAGDPNHVVIGTRRGGYFVTRDGGTSWSWICEAGIGYDDEEVYPGALLGNGALVVSTGFGGLAISPDGCGWSPWLPSEQPFVADVRVSATGDRVVVLEARAAGEAFVNRLWQSTDQGGSWQELGEPFAADSQALSFALSESGEVFAGSAGPAGAELWRAGPDAVGWQRLQLSGEPAVRPRIVGASGSGESARIYAVLNHAVAEGITTPADSVVVSSDGGASFRTLLHAQGEIAASALSADGDRLAVGGHADGVHVLEQAKSALPDAELPQVSTMSVHALAWGDGGQLYAAGHEAIDGFSVGVSSDAGRSFAPLFALCQVTGPLACSADSAVGAQCSSSGETGWDVRKEVANPDACRDPDADQTPEVDSPAPSSAQPAVAPSAKNAASCAFSAGYDPSVVGSLLVAMALVGYLGRRSRRHCS